jgi:HEAT repeat protein
MRRLAHAESFAVRMTAVKTLASIRELDNVPTLIYALSDPDLRVMKTARDGLRFSSRKLGGFGLRDEPTPKERSEAIKAWKQWYLAIRPEAFFPQ